MYYIIGAFLVSGLLYWILQGKEDEKATKEGRPVAGVAKRILLFFFLMVVMTCLFFFIGNAVSKSHVMGMPLLDNGVQRAGAQDKYKVDMVRNIKEDVIVGLPPFGVTEDDA